MMRFCVGHGNDFVVALTAIEHIGKYLPRVASPNGGPLDSPAGRNPDYRS